MNPLSIVIPCYNEAENLNQIIEKLDDIHQQNPDVEIVLVDNGSTDSTPEVLKELIEPRKHFITRHRIEKNQGYGHGIMSGIRIARAKYFLGHMLIYKRILWMSFMPIKNSLKIRCILIVF